MDIKEAAARAKSFITELYAEEGATRIGLEQVRFDADHEVWRVVVGFTREWELPQTDLLLAVAPRTFKTVILSDIGDVLEVLDDVE